MFDDIIATLEMCKKPTDITHGHLARIDAAISKLQTVQRDIEDLIDVSDDILSMVTVTPAALPRRRWHCALGGTIQMRRRNRQ